MVRDRMSVTVNHW